MAPLIVEPIHVDGLTRLLLVERLVEILEEVLHVAAGTVLPLSGGAHDVVEQRVGDLLPQLVQQLLKFLARRAVDKIVLLQFRNS